TLSDGSSVSSSNGHSWQHGDLRRLDGSLVGLVLSGTNGNDTLTSGPHSDALNGGAGNDTLQGGNLDNGIYKSVQMIQPSDWNNRDLADYSAATAPVLVNLQTGVASGDASVGIDTL